MNYYAVAVNYPKRDSLLTYASSEKFHPGSVVDIPLGRRKSQGVVIRLTDLPPGLEAKKIKEIEGISEEFFTLTESELSLYTWMSDYYHYSLGKLIFDSIPKKLKRPRTIVRDQGEPAQPFKLAPEQQKITDQISESLDLGFSQHLIHGVTGSGKSLMYLELMKKVLALGKSVHFVLPEINLTPQFIKLFSENVSVPVFVYHSNVTHSEKYSLWKHLLEKEEPVLAIGVRSSLFLPFKNLGLIVVDEEHDSSFKQDARCLYNAKDSLQKKALDHNVPIILGSATPSLETFYHYKEKKNYYYIDKRYGDAHLPELKFLEAKFVEENADLWPLTRESVQEITKALDKKEQVLVFINKLGFAHFMQCRSCGHQFKCQNCDSNLRVFKEKHKLDCNVCGYHEIIPKSCPECGNLKLLNKGFGTEKVAEVLTSLFPDQNIERFDREEITTMKKLEEKLKNFADGRIDILVGTQMLSKGHNFERVNLVVMLGIDSQMNFADFRAQERTYQTIKQVSGRAGRYSQEGKVLIQTMTPKQPLFTHIKEGKDLAIFQGELEYRKISESPPFSYLTTLYITSKFRDRVMNTAEEIAAKLRGTINKEKMEIQIMGPAPMIIEKRVNQFSWYLTLKAKKRGELHQLLMGFEAEFQEPSSTTVKINVDP